MIKFLLRLTFSFLSCCDLEEKLFVPLKRTAKPFFQTPKSTWYLARNFCRMFFFFFSSRVMRVGSYASRTSRTFYG